MFKKLLLVLACLLVFAVTPVMAQDFCEGNFDCNLTVDGLDAAIFKSDFGRSGINNPCPISSDCCSGTLSPLGRWCDQNNGTVKDMTTGLIWLKDAGWGGLYAAWAAYGSYDANYRPVELESGVGGLSDGSVLGDWRLPAVTELAAIALGTESISPDEMRFFINVDSGDYWSCTRCGAYELQFGAAMRGYAWGPHPKTEMLRVWPVRGGQSLADLET